jgi:hypothetical protein
MRAHIGGERVRAVADRGPLPGDAPLVCGTTTISYGWIRVSAAQPQARRD